MKCKLGVILIPIFCSLVTSLFAQQRDKDRIDPLQGSPVSGVISKVSPTVIELDNGARRFNVNEVEKVTFGDEVDALRNGRTRLASGQLEEAMSLLNSIPPENISRDLVRADLEFYRAYCAGRLALTGGGDKAAAATAIIEFFNKYPESFHYFQSAELIGDLAFAMGRFDSASEYYQKLAQAPWPDYQLRAKVLEGRALLADNKADEALKRYDEVLAASADTSTALRQKTMAQVGKAICLAETGKADEGQQLVETVIRDNDPQNGELFGQAYNALGVCHLKANRPKDALLAFLHVHLLFTGNAEAHAQSLYYLSQLWSASGRSDRAVEARSLLKSRYAGTSWASKQ